MAAAAFAAAVVVVVAARHRHIFGLGRGRALRIGGLHVAQLRLFSGCNRTVGVAMPGAPPVVCFWMAQMLLTQFLSCPTATSAVVWVGLAGAGRRRAPAILAAVFVAAGALMLLTHALMFVAHPWNHVRPQRGPRRIGP